MFGWRSAIINYLLLTFSMVSASWLAFRGWEKYIFNQREHEVQTQVESKTFQLEKEFQKSKQAIKFWKEANKHFLGNNSSEDLQNSIEHFVKEHDQFHSFAFIDSSGQSVIGVSSDTDKEILENFIRQKNDPPRIENYRFDSSIQSILIESPHQYHRVILAQTENKSDNKKKKSKKKNFERKEEIRVGTLVATVYLPHLEPIKAFFVSDEKRNPSSKKLNNSALQILSFNQQPLVIKPSQTKAFQPMIDHLLSVSKSEKALPFFQKMNNTQVVCFRESSRFDQDIAFDLGRCNSFDNDFLPLQSFFRQALSLYLACSILFFVIFIIRYFIFKNLLHQLKLRVSSIFSLFTPGKKLSSGDLSLSLLEQGMDTISHHTQALLDNFSQLVFFVTPSLQIVWGNHAFISLMNFPEPIDQFPNTKNIFFADENNELPFEGENLKKLGHHQPIIDNQCSLLDIKKERKKVILSVFPLGNTLNTPIGYVVIGSNAQHLEDVLERLNAEKLHAEEQQKRLIASEEINRAISSQLHTDKVFEILTEKMDTLLHYEILGVGIKDDEENLKIMNVSEKSGQGLFQSGQNFTLDDSALGETVRTGESKHYQEDPDTLCTDLDICFKSGIKSVLVLPIKQNQECIGAMIIAANNIDDLSQKTAEILQPIADQLAIAYNNSRLYGQVEKSLNDTTRMNEELSVLNTKYAQANEELKELDSMKHNFTSMIVHELRNPLTGIMGFSQLLSEETPEPEKVQKFAEKIYGESKRLNCLVNDVLDYNKIAAGKMDYEIQEYDLLSIIQSAIEILTPSAQEKNIRIYFEHSGEAGKNDFPIKCDPDRIKQVVINLLSNAIKFNYSDKIIRIHALSLEQDYLVKIQDEGIGIDPKNLVKIFTPFVQISDGKKMGKGTGLGLALCKKIIHDGHHGNLWIYSAGKDLGSTSYFSLPVNLRKTKADIRSPEIFWDKITFEDRLISYIQMPHKPISYVHLKLDQWDQYFREASEDLHFKLDHHLAEIFHKYINASDLVTRDNNGIYRLVFTDVLEKDLHTTLERITSSIKSDNFRINNDLLTLSASIGAAHLSVHETQRDGSFINGSYSAMLHSQTLGGNKISIA